MVLTITTANVGASNIVYLEEYESCA